MSEWIKVEDELPEEKTLVLVVQEGAVALRLLVSPMECPTGWYDENNNYDDSDLEITHWMPLPIIG